MAKAWLGKAIAKTYKEVKESSSEFHSPQCDQALVRPGSTLQNVETLYLRPERPLLPLAAWASPMQIDDLTDPYSISGLGQDPHGDPAPDRKQAPSSTDHLGFVGSAKAVFDLKDDIELAWHDGMLPLTHCQYNLV